MKALSLLIVSRASQLEVLHGSSGTVEVNYYCGTSVQLSGGQLILTHEGAYGTLNCQLFAITEAHWVALKTFFLYFLLF